MSATAAPVLQKERIGIIDSLRGVAILGILLMNIPSFAWSISGWDPSIYYESGWNYRIWYAVNLLPEGTQRGLFSLLFGAGILLFMRNKEQQHPLITPSDYFFRRQLWLLFFGLVNIYVLLWPGDILFDYGLYGLLIFVCRLWKPRQLMMAALACMLFMLARENRNLYLDKQTIDRGESVAKIDTTQTKLTPTQSEWLENMQGFRKKTTREAKMERMESVERHVRGNYESVYTQRTDTYLSHFLEYSYFSIWDVVSLMLLGMAFFKLGILTGQYSTRFYGLMALIGLGLGLFLTYLDIAQWVRSGYNYFDYAKEADFSFRDPARILRTLGIFGLLIFLFKMPWMKWFFWIFRPVGQMAFTNYLTQSLICAILFYGVGFGLYGTLPRYQGYLIVFAIWIVQIIWSHLWLRYFLYGPFEWWWRQLTYWKKLPIRRAAITN